MPKARSRTRRSNVLLIISDTLRRDYLGCYGNTRVRTPNIDGLARDAAVFSNCYVASFPTGPHRKDLHSGRFTFAYTAWHEPWKPDHPVLAEILRDAGYTTAMIGDTGSNKPYEDGFDHFEIVSGLGQWADQPRLRRAPAKLMKLRGPRQRIRGILRKEGTWASEEDRCAPQTMRAAHRWLETQVGPKKPFFLMVDTFDPHEPWNQPKYYTDFYDPHYKGNELFEPAYAPADYATKREIEHMRRLYAGEVTMVDHWIGYLLDGLERMGLADETIVILNSDHGFYHGEHGLIGKVHLSRRNAKLCRWPLYETIAQEPLIVRIPGARAKQSISAFCQPPDITATILDMVGIPAPSHVQGRSLRPLMAGKVKPVRDCAVSCWTYSQDAEVRSPAAFRTRDWLYVYGGDEWESELYDLRSDPDELRNVIRTKGGIAAEMHERYVEFLREIECPEDRLRGRLEFAPKRRRGPYNKML